MGNGRRVECGPKTVMGEEIPDFPWTKHRRRRYSYTMTRAAILNSPFISTFMDFDDKLI